MSWTDDPVADFERHDRAQAQRIARRPRCSYCDEHIQDDELFDIEGELICHKCLNQHFKKNTEDYIYE